MNHTSLKFCAIILGAVIMNASHASTITVYHQPLPMKQSAVDSINASLADADKIVPHITDGYLYSCGETDGCTYPGDGPIPLHYPSGFTKFLHGPLLPSGFDSQNAWNLPLLKFDTRGLPQVDIAPSLLLYQQKSSGPVNAVDIYRLGSPWDESVDMNTLPLTGDIIFGDVCTPGDGQWFGIDISQWYNGWVTGQSNNDNNGIMLFAQSSTPFFRSSQYVAEENGLGMEDHRPIIKLTFTPTLELKLPLPSDATWLLTTEIGSADCLGVPDTHHTDSNGGSSGVGDIDGTHVYGGYFSIDISADNKSMSETQLPTYSTPTTTSSEIPILAAARGKVRTIGRDDNPLFAQRGNYVIIDHLDSNNNPNGFSTRYLHMFSVSNSLNQGDIIPQGKKLGLMGNTGISFGPHLHFGVSYYTPNQATTSLSTTPELQKVVMEGLLLKSYQTECSYDPVSDAPHRIRYYNSTNVTVE